MRAALLDPTGLVVNAIVIGPGYEPPDGHVIVELAADSPVGPGWQWQGANGGTWTEPEPVEPEPAPPTLEEQIVALQQALAEKDAKLANQQGQIDDLGDLVFMIILGG